MPSPTKDQGTDRSQINLSGRLPPWLWALIAAVLGLGIQRRLWRWFIAKFLYFTTLVSAASFSVCGIMFIVFDVVSKGSKTTILIGVCKTIMGAYWVGTGLYAHGLARRLFNNNKLVDCIRMHSKTVFKINTVFILVILSVASVVLHFYDSKYLLGETIDAEVLNDTAIRDENCADANLDVRVCQVLYLSSGVFAIFTLTWNLLVASILLSVCRTHTVCIRRFMNVLMNDVTIYEEYLMQQAFGPKYKVQLLEKSIHHTKEDSGRRKKTVESLVWADDIKRINEEMNKRRSKTKDLQRSAPLGIPTNDSSRNFGTSGTPRIGVADGPNPPRIAFNLQDDEDALGTLPTYTQPQAPFNTDTEMLLGDPGDPAFLPIFRRNRTATNDNLWHTSRLRHDHFQHNRPRSHSHHGGSRRANHNARQKATIQSGSSETDVDSSANEAQKSGAVTDDEVFSQSWEYERDLDMDAQAAAMASEGPPILSNENLMFTYFQLVRRLTSTSRLLQRWMVSVITMTLLWCMLIIVHWTSHNAELTSFLEFGAPLVILFLLSSTCAEVNFEGERLLACVLPTKDRMSVLYYMRNVPLQLKVFSFTLTYNVIVTVVAGAIVTFATRVVLEKVGFDI